MSWNKILTGAITNADGGTVTTFGATAAKTVIANATNGSAAPAALAGSAAFQHLRVNSANNALEWATLSSYASTSITYTSDTFQRAALTGDVTASANSNATTIVNDAVTNAKKANMAAGTINGRSLGSGTGDPEDLTGVQVGAITRWSGTQTIGLTAGTTNTITVNDGVTYVYINITGTGDVTIDEITYGSSNTGARIILAKNTGTGRVILTNNAGKGTSQISTVNSRDWVIQGTLGSTEVFHNGFTWCIEALEVISSARINSGGTTFTRQRLNFIAGSGISLSIGEDATDLEIDVTIAATTGGHIIKDDGASLTQRSGLNFVSSSTIQVTGSDDAGNNETDVTFDRGALTGAIVSSLGSAATTFGGILDNGAAENNRTNLNFLSGDSITLSVTDDAGGDELEISADYTGTTSEVTIAGATGNLGTIDISALVCGGSVRVTSASSAYSIEGFTSKSVGFWFYFDADVSTTNHCTLLNEDATATTTNRLALPGTMDLNSGGIRGIFYYRENRWNYISSNPRKIGVATGYVQAPDGTTNTIEMVTPANDITMTAGGSGAVVINAADLDVNATQMTLTPVPRSDAGTLTGGLASWAPLFLIYRDVTSSGSTSAGDTTLFSGNAPFDFMVVMSGVSVTTGQGGASFAFRDATGGGGNAVSSSLSVISSGTVQYSTNYTGLATIASGGSLVGRWSNRTCVGRIWALCIRTS